jgi:hypothetical protein
MNNIYELIEYLVDREFEDDPYGELEDMLYEKYEIDIHQLTGLLDDLLPLCHKEKSELTGITYVGFASPTCWLLRQEKK